LSVVGTGPAADAPHAVPDFRDTPSEARKRSTTQPGVI